MPLDHHRVPTGIAQDPPPGYAQGRIRRARQALADRPALADRIVCLTYLAVVVLTTAVYLVPTVIWFLHPPGSPRALLVVGVSTAAGVLGAVALRWRRRRPIVVVGVMTALATGALAITGAPGATVLGVALAVHALAATWPPVPTWPAVVVSVSVLAFALLTWLSLDVLDLGGILSATGPPTTEPPPDAWPRAPWSGHDRAELAGIESRFFEVWLAVLTQLTAVATGLGVRGRRERGAAADAQARALAREHRQEILLARTAERTGIAREVHDVVAHSISVMVALSDGAAAVAPRSPERAQTAMREVSETGRAALADMRRVLTALDEPAPDPHDEVADVSMLVERFRAAGLPVTAPHLDVEAPGPVLLATRRIVAEGLTNVLRHAPGAGRLTVRVARTADAVEIEVLDDGPGADAERAGGQTTGTGRGLRGVRERAAILGGQAQAGPVPGGGWRVAATLPVDQPAGPRRQEAR